MCRSGNKFSWTRTSQLVELTSREFDATSHHNSLCSCPAPSRENGGDGQRCEGCPAARVQSNLIPSCKQPVRAAVLQYHAWPGSRTGTWHLHGLCDNVGDDYKWKSSQCSNGRVVSRPMQIRHSQYQTGSSWTRSIFTACTCPGAKNESRCHIFPGMICHRVC